MVAAVEAEEKEGERDDDREPGEDDADGCDDGWMIEWKEK